MATKMATNNDLNSLWYQAYPEASTAPTNTLAKSQSDVDAMSGRDRLWQALDYGYGIQRRASDESYAQAISQQDRAALSRGMQRSSYNAATTANMRNKQVQAQNDIYGSQIAAYAQGLQTLEEQERQQGNWEKEFYNQYVSQIAANGGTPSDELLALAGLTRADYDQLKPQMAAGGGGGGTTTTRSRGRGNNGKGDENGKNDQDQALADYMNTLFGGASNAANNTTNALGSVVNSVINTANSLLNRRNNTSNYRHTGTGEAFD